MEACVESKTGVVGKLLLEGGEIVKPTTEMEESSNSKESDSTAVSTSMEFVEATPDSSSTAEDLSDPIDYEALELEAIKLEEKKKTKMLRRYNFFIRTSRPNLRLDLIIPIKPPPGYPNCDPEKEENDQFKKMKMEEAVDHSDKEASKEEVKPDTN